MTKINVDFNSITGEIKPMHAVGQPPFRGGFAKLDFTPMQILKDANIPYSRLHDVGGAFGSNRYVDITIVSASLSRQFRWSPQGVLIHPEVCHTENLSFWDC